MSTGHPANFSIHSAQIQEVHDIPVSVLIRPLAPVLDEAKVSSIMEALKVKYAFTIWCTTKWLGFLFFLSFLFLKRWHCIKII